MGETPPLASHFRDILYDRVLLFQGNSTESKKSTGVIFLLLLECQVKVEGRIMGLVGDIMGV